MPLGIISASYGLGTNADRVLLPGVRCSSSRGVHNYPDTDLLVGLAQL